MKRLVVIAGLAALAVAGGLAFWFLKAVPSVSVDVAREGPVVEAVYATAVVEPVLWAKVGPTVGGRIASIAVDEGDKVRAGQELARLDDRAARARIRELKARIDFLAADVARLKPLVARGFASRQSFERAESDLHQARAALAALEQGLDTLVLRAPMDGTVLRRDGEVGEAVVPESTIFWVGQPSPLRAEAEVDEEDIPRVRVGQRVLIKADAFPGEVLDGKVSDITPKGDPVSKSYRVRIALPADTPLMIGMTVETNIVVRTVERAVLVPTEAVVDGRVWVIEDGRAQSREVRTGVRGEGRVEIREGIAAGTRVIVGPPAGLEDGARVRARAVPAS